MTYNKALISNCKYESEQSILKLKNLRLLSWLYVFLIIGSIVMPQYFGFRVGVDITCTRLGVILLFAYFVLNTKVFTHFCGTICQCNILVPLGMYLFVAAYTMVYRVDINAFFSVFMETITFLLMIHGIRHVIGFKRVLKWINGCSYFFCVYGIIEFIYGKSIYLQFLRTLPTAVANGYRSGNYRIMGPCGHSLGYGLVLLLLFTMACYDADEDKIYLFRRPLLVVLLMVNVFLTGSRSTLGLVVVESIVIILLSGRNNMIKSILLLCLVLLAASAFLVLLRDTSIGRYMLGQIASVVDELLGTEYAALFGVNIEQLQNSTEYRKALPYIFTLDWLNPLVGRGGEFHGAEINGIYIQSVDHFYVLQYIKYAYPGLIAYVSFMIVTLVTILRECVKKTSKLPLVVLVGFIAYFVNLWWVDSLQTIKYMYLLLAIFYAYYLEKRGK